MAIREVIFRGKRTDNGEWVCGYYTKARYFLNKKEMHIIFEPDVEAFPHCEFTGYEEVLPETVGQYTGLTDKNGKRIFEGDIIVVEGEKWCVGYDDMRARFALFHTSWELMRNIPNYCEREVIGNIHDNSKILKGGGENG